MSFMSDYKAALKKLKKEEEEQASQKTSTNKGTSASTKADSSFMAEYKAEKNRLAAEQAYEDLSEINVGDLAPVGTKKKEENTWFKSSGLFDDGYQFGDITRTILGTGADVLENLGAGVMGMGEKAIDALAYLAPAANVAQQSQNSLAYQFDIEDYKKQQEEQKKFIQKDLYNEEAIAKKILSDPARKIGIDAEAHSVLGEKSDSLVQSGGQLLGTIGLQAAGVPWWVTSGTTTFGSEAENAMNQGSSYEEAGLSAAVSAGAEMLTEKLFGGSGLGETGLINTDLLTRGISNKLVKSLADYGVDIASEGFEEVVSELASNFGSALYQEEKLGDILFSEEAIEGYIDSFIGGGVLGGFANASKFVGSAKNGTDYRYDFTQNEQKVVDKIYEERLAELEKNGKVSAAEKSKLYEAVSRDLEKGYISTDTIEEVLGDKDYQTYQETAEYEDAIFEEYEELGNKQNATLAEQSRYAELQRQVADIKKYSTREGLKNKLSESVYQKVQGDRLAESYNEKARRGQKFEADLSQYDAKQQQTIQNAINSGTLNNTNRTHELVDFIAKVSADKGVLFDFTNNEKIKGTRFAVEGKIVNGYVTDSGITLNVESPKYLESTVGHEITHVLEGTEFYDTLQKTIFDYAKSKGEFDSRMSSLTEMYKDIEGADVEAELTADLVGDYIFSDTDFVNKLSTENRNVFQKIYDEIKYLCKVVTAGSKEARQLEKAKKVFEDAYQAKGKQTDTKYSLTAVDAVQPKSDKWSRTHTTEEAMARFPNMWNVAAEESEVRNPTQITSTVNSYRKIYNFLKDEGFNGTILDASSGLGYGTRAGIEEYGFDVEDIEPYPDKGYKPKYQDYSALDKKYDVIISNAVLNVLPQDQRDALAVKMGEMLNDGGRMFINVRGKDVESLAKTGKNIHLGNMEWIETVKGSYQKGFTKPELVAYLQDALGDEFTVKPTNMFGAVSAVVTKNGAKYSLSDSDGKQLTKEQQEYFKDSKMRDEQGNLKVMYHGTQDAGFHVFDAKMSDDDTSFFFVDRNDVATSYSGTSETYEAKTIRSAEDMNNFLDEIGYDHYKAVEINGRFELLENNEHVATKDTAQEIYEEFCWYEGIGDGDANYKVYLNLKNPLEVDAEGRNWDNVGREFSQEVYDKYQSLTPEERAALVDLAEWEDYDLFRSEIYRALDEVENGSADENYRTIANAHWKVGNTSVLFDMASDNFSENSIRESAFKKLKTRDYAQKAKAEGYDGVIFRNIIDNGGYSNGSEGASTVAIAFDSNQIKSTANEKPTADPDIRYSLSDSEGESVVALDGGSVTKYSLSTWTPETQAKVRDNLVKAGYEEDRVDKWIKDTNNVASVIAADRDRLDFIAADNQTMLKSNQEYVKTLDASTLCAKRLVYQGTFDAIQHRMPNTMLSSDDLIDLLNMMKEHGVQTPCGVCYVESRRRHLGKFAQEWLNGYKGEYKPNLDEVTTSDGLEVLRKTHPDTYKDFITAMKKKGSANPKVVQLRTEYRNEIMSLTPAQIRKIESIGGLRVQSFSDFETPHLLDMMQAVMDMSAKGLTSQAYTKVPNFAWVFGDTGIKINLSLIAEGNGFDSDGNLAFSSTEGMDINEAMKLRDAYSKNVGTIIVGANDKHILACMADDRIDFIIPFHRSGWGQKELDMMGMSSYTDYTYGQNEHSLETGKGVPNLYPPDYWDYNLSGKENAERYLNLCARTGREPKFSQFLVNNGDGSYSLQPDGSTDGYWKTLIDFKMYDNEGNGAAQQKVQPNFNMDEAYRVLNEYEGGANKLPVATEVVEEFVAKYTANDLAPAMSLSNVGDTPYGRGTLGKDVAYAPVAENATTEESTAVGDKMEATVAENATVSKEEMAAMFPDNLAPVQDELERLTSEEAALRSVMEGYASVGDIEAVNKLIPEHEAIKERIRELEADENQRADSLTETDVPPEAEAPYYGESQKIPNPFADRNWNEVGRNRSAKAFVTENPEFKPFFQEAASIMLYDLSDSQKAERWYNDQLHYDSGGEKGFGGQKRFTSSDIAELLDSWGLTYAQIEEGLTAIAEDNAKVNNMPAKRIEFKLNERLMNGYKDFHTGKMVAPNQAYLDMLSEWQANAQSQEAFDSFMANADMYAPMEDVAPVKPLEKATPDTDPAPIYETREEGTLKGQTTMFEPPKPNPKVATVLTEESAIAKEKSGIGGKLVSALVDKGMVFENLSLKTGNQELQSKYNYALPSNSEARAQYFMEHGANGVKPLKGIIGEVKKTGKTEQFYDYLYHVHNIDRMTLEDRFENTPNKTVFGETVTASVSRVKARQYEKANPEFKSMAEDVYAYNRHLRNLLVENGVISRETAELWQRMYPHYVPIRRDGDKGLNINVPLDSNKTGVNAPIKRAVGGSGDILPLFETMAMRTEQTYKAIARNAFGIELKNTLGTTLDNQLEKMGVDEVIDTIDAQDDKLLKPGTLNSNPTFTVFENGERVEFEITEDMYDALKPAGKILGYRNQAVKAVGDARRNLLTQWNPVFALYRNPIKDLQEVAINSQHPVKTYLNIPNAIFQMATKGKYATEYHRSGGKSNTYFDSKTHKFKAEDNIFKKTIGMPVRAIETAGEFIEEIPRLAEYIASRQDGRSVERSMLDAARVTTNFAAGGDFTKFLNSHGFTFLNASVQGASQHVRNFREAKANGLKGYVKVLAKYTVAGLPGILLNSMLWDDDEDYEELSDYVKQNYYVVAKTEDGKFVRIPKGRTAAVIQNAMEQMQNLVTGDDEADFGTFFELFMNNIAPNNPIENNILAPIGQVMNNEAWYGGDLVPSRLQSLPAEEQFDESTDSISKWLGEKTGTSPYKWNYLIDQYSGGLGDVFLPMLTPEAESGDNTLMGNILAPWKKEITTDKVLNNKNPGDFYDLKDELEVMSNSRNATEEDTMRSMYMDSVSWEMSDLYKQKREVQSGDLPDDEKYEQVREIQEQINALAENALNVYDHVQISGLYSEVGDKRYNKDAESGKWYEIREKNSDGSDNYYYQKEQEVTQGLGISYSDYWNNREEYNYAYDNPEQYTLAQSVGGYQAYRGYLSELWDINADKDENGKSISGSRKEKVIDYLNELDADYYTKIILFKNEYNADDTYNYEIIDYLNGREDISYEQMETILKYLGFEVDSEGNISW